jgi:alanine racemase
MSQKAALVPGPSAHDRASDAPIRVLRPRRASPEQTVRPTRAEIDLAAVRGNLRALRKVAGRARIWAVLKADGYGHGAPAVARTLERSGVDGLAVALLEEAIELRDAGIRAPVLVMGGYYGRAYDELLAHDLVPVVYDASHFELLARAIRLVGHEERVLVHLKIDTGMSRLGVRPEQLRALLEAAAAFPQIVVDGVMTHFSSADVPGEEGEAAMLEQLATFAQGLAIVRKAGHAPRFVHASNSAALLGAASLASARGVADARFDAVRPGIALFGVSPSAHLPCPELKPTLRVRSEIVALRTVPAGTPVGYGATFRAQRDTVVATVPMGYADGLPRALSNAGSMLVRGRRAPIIGSLSMDLATLDVTDVPGASMRDEVVAVGEQRGALGRDEITVQEIAQLAGLIPWDVMTSISRRVPRFYRDF